MCLSLPLVFYCDNEDHNPGIEFQSLAQKKIHLIKAHTSFYESCNHYEELNENLARNYDEAHAQTSVFEVCDLRCLATTKSTDQHKRQQHFQCN